MPDFKDTTPFVLKNHFNAELVAEMVDAFADAWPAFAKAAFRKTALQGLDQLEFSGRTRHLAAALRSHLPEDVPEALDILVAALPPAPEGEEVRIHDHWWLWPLGDFIRDYGGDHFEASMAACYELTQRFSAEFGIRPSLAAEPKKGLERLLHWTADPNLHVRRLASEGSRPRLPWASRLDLPRPAVVRILTALRDDPALYVRRSVANHLNDLGKDDPEWLVELLGKWQRGAKPKRLWVIRHALRNHIKQGHPGALALLGFGNAKLAEVNLEISPKLVPLGETLVLVFSAKNASKDRAPLLVDFSIHYQKANGTLSKKVFKWTEREVAPGETLELTKKLTMVHRSTRVLHPGEHRAEVQINGEIFAAEGFALQF